MQLIQLLQKAEELKAENLLDDAIAAINQIKLINQEHI